MDVMHYHDDGLTAAAHLRRGAALGAGEDAVVRGPALPARLRHECLRR